MTALAELERLARAQVPPVGAVYAVAIVEGTPGGRLPRPLEAYPNGLGVTTAFGAAWLLASGRTTAAIATFAHPVDACRLVALLNGEAPASRAPLAPTTPEASTRAVPDPAAPEAPDERLDGSSPSGPVGTPARRCPGCGGPIPPGRRGQARRTCSLACRQRARRHPGAFAAGPDTGGHVTPSEAPGPSEPGTTWPAPPSRDERGAPEQLPIFGG